MLYTITCKEKGCANKGIEYLMPNPHADVMCGGCKTFITATETDIPEPPVPEFVTFGNV